MAELFKEDDETVVGTVVDGQTIEWTFNPHWTEDVVHLVNSNATMVGEDVEVTKLTSAFGIMSFEGPINLITRRLSRGVIADLLVDAHPMTHWAIIGSPGLGKSFTLIYALQQALMNNGAFVVFSTQKNQHHFVCIGRKNKIFVWTSRGDNLLQSKSLFGSEQALVLMDPEEADRGNSPIGQGARRLIYAATSDIKHFASDIMKTISYPK
jgi:hypothetical protein